MWLSWLGLWLWLLERGRGGRRGSWDSGGRGLRCRARRWFRGKGSRWRSGGLFCGGGLRLRGWFRLHNDGGLITVRLGLGDRLGLWLWLLHRGNRGGHDGLGNRFLRRGENRGFGGRRSGRLLISGYTLLTFIFALSSLLLQETEDIVEDEVPVRLLGKEECLNKLFPSLSSIGHFTDDLDDNATIRGGLSIDGVNEDLAILETDGSNTIVNFLGDGGESDHGSCVAGMKTACACLPVDHTPVCHPHPLCRG